LAHKPIHPSSHQNPTPEKPDDDRPQRPAPLRAPRAAAVAEPATAAANNGKALGDARPVFPFTAIVGQEEMKLALLLNVLDPKIGGVMVMGDRGTGKSTTIRALADLLPEMPVVAGDPFNSHPEDPELMSEEVREWELGRVEDG
jgi:magnesium chelatase subunit I